MGSSKARVTKGGQVEDELDKAELDKRTKQEFVTAAGQMAADPRKEVLRRSNRVKELNRRMEGYCW